MTGQGCESIKRPLIYRITLLQLVIVVPCVLGALLIWPAAALGMLAGALIELVSRAYFGYYAFRFIGAQQISLVVGAFRRGEFGKFILVAVLFGLLFILAPDVQPLAVFVGYLVSWFVGACLSFRMLR